MYTCLCQCKARIRPGPPSESSPANRDASNASPTRTVTPGKVLLRRIIAMLPMHYDLSALMHKATQDAEPKASGGTCDVTFGTVPCTTASRGSCMSPSSARARAHVLNSLPPEKREKFIKVRLNCMYVY